MPENTEATTATADTATGTEAEATTATTTETTPDGDDLAAEVAKWKGLSRKHEAASKANADKARQYDELEEAQKTEQQKLLERAEKAERLAAETEARAMRVEIAAAKGVPASLLSGSSREDLEASADALLEFRGEAAKPTPPDFGGGNRGKDVEAPGIDDQIAAAQTAGDWRTVIALQNSKLPAAAKQQQQG